VNEAQFGGHFLAQLFDEEVGELGLAGAVLCDRYARGLIYDDYVGVLVNYFNIIFRHLVSFYIS
jgi:hypothetical protein